MTQSPSFAETLAESRRLAILRLLKEIGGSSNESILHAGTEQLGFRRESRTTIRDDLSMMVKHGLLKEEWFNDLMVVTITSRGVEVTEGRISVPGVKKPGIGE